MIKYTRGDNNEVLLEVIITFLQFTTIKNQVLLPLIIKFYSQQQSQSSIVTINNQILQFTTITIKYCYD